MSFTASKWARKMKVGNATGKIILIAIADHADDKGAGFASQKTLADESECSLATVTRWLKTFEEKGILSRKKRYGEGGYRRSDSLHLNLHLTELHSRELHSTELQNSLSILTPHSDVAEPIREPKKEKDSKDTIPKKSKSKSDIDLEFEEIFWPQYPRRIDKQPALKSFRAARKKTDLEIIMAGVLRYAAERDGHDEKFTKYPSRWLNNKCWLNETEQPGAPPTQGKVRTNSPEFFKQLAGLSNAADTNNDANHWNTIEEDAGQNAGSLGHGGTVGAAIRSVSLVN